MRVETALRRASHRCAPSRAQACSRQLAKRSQPRCFSASARLLSSATPLPVSNISASPSQAEAHALVARRREELLSHPPIRRDGTTFEKEHTDTHAAGLIACAARGFASRQSPRTMQAVAERGMDGSDRLR